MVWMMTAIVKIKMMTVMVIDIIITKAACRIRMTIAVMNTANEDLASRGCWRVGAFACFTCSTPEFVSHLQGSVGVCVCVCVRFGQVVSQT